MYFLFWNLELAWKNVNGKKYIYIYNVVQLNVQRIPSILIELA